MPSFLASNDTVPSENRIGYIEKEECIINCAQKICQVHSISKHTAMAGNKTKVEFDLWND